VGCFLTVSATPLWDGEPCAPPVALRLPRRVEPAPARPHAHARLRGLGDRRDAAGAAGGGGGKLRVMTYNGRALSSLHQILPPGSSSGLAGVSVYARPAGLPHPRGPISCCKPPPLTTHNISHPNSFSLLMKRRSRSHETACFQKPT